MRRFAQILTLFMVVVLSAHAVPAVLNYVGQVAVNGQPFDGQGLFKFALVNADGNTTYWSNDETSANGSEPSAHVSIAVNGGLYSLLLGNTAMSGMGAIDPQVFAQHGDAKLRVWFSDGVNGFQQLSPDRPFASVPYAFSAGTAQSATIADGSINKSMLGSDLIADLNATIGMNRLSAEVSAKLDQNIQFENNDTTMVAFRVRKENNQTGLTNSDHIKVTWDSTNFDHDADFDLSQDAFIVPETGLYAISSSARFSFVETGVFAHLIIKQNNESINSGVAIRAGGNSGYYISSVSALIDANESDIISILAGQSGSSQPISIVGSVSTYFEGFKISGNSLNTIQPNSINKSMLGSDVIADLNKTVTITRDMLPADVLSDLNRTISKPMLGSDVIADLNATIGMDRLSEEVITKLDQNVSGGAGVVAGSLVSVPYGQSAPDGYSLYQQGTPKELVWEEKAPVSVARYAYDGVEVLDGKIYFVGGHDGSNKNIAERYDPATNTWGTLASMSVARGAVATAILNGKLYAIGGQGVASVEVYDPSTESWSAGVALPSEVNHGTAITVNEKIYLIGGRNASEQNMNQVLCLDPFTNQWSTKANMPTARHGAKLVWFEDRIWAIGGRSPNMSKVESYNPITDSWQTEVPLSANRGWPVAWVASGRIFVGGGDNGSYLSSIETYNPTAKQWSNLGNLPENKFVADAVVLNDQVYVIAGQTASGVYSNKVYAADLNASVAGVYDLYRKDGNASAGTPLVQAEVADGSVTASKMADGAVSKSALDATILKYLKPEITSQPHAQMFYEGGNISLSITAEGKYLTYQWKKDGVDLTGETNATLKITDANATLHDGNYSVVVRNTFGSLESNLRFIDVNQSWKKDGLIAWLPFDGNSSDMSDNKNNAIVSGNPTWSDGKISQAINLNGSDQFINLTLECPITFSISCWIKTSDDAAAITGVDQSFVYWLDNYKLRFEVNNGTWKQPITYNVANTWTFTVAIYDSILNESIIYKDGDFFSKRVILNKINNSNHFVIGKKPLGSGRFFQGLIDDFRIYDRALSAAEVQALYNMGQ